MKITAGYCRRKAASFYLSSINGIVEDWIDDDEDPTNEVDQDVKDLAIMLWKVVQDAVKFGVGGL